MQPVELFFLAGDVGEQSHFLIYPASLDDVDMQEILDTTDAEFEKTFRSDSLVRFKHIEEILKTRGISPDPLKVKDTTEWRYFQLSKGGVMFRFGLDGRRESKTGLVNSSIEGCFLPGIDIVKTAKKYRKKGIDIISEIGKQIPDDMEKHLVGANFELFQKLYRDYSIGEKLDSLYNHFYVACIGNEIEVSLKVEVPPLCKLGPIGKMMNK